jgi:RHS repeat-associated protein
MVVYIYGAQRGNPDMGHVAIPLTRLPSHQYDAATYKFTGKERDSESGLDNFGARYFGSSLGRFQTPDPVFMNVMRVMDR